MHHTTNFFLMGVVLFSSVIAVSMWQQPVDRRVLMPEDAGRRIDMNQEDAATLALLPGIGLPTADRIIQSRQADGPFANVDDVARVKYVRRQAASAIGRYAVCGPVNRVNPADASAAATQPARGSPTTLK